MPPRQDSGVQLCPSCVQLARSGPARVARLTVPSFRDAAMEALVTILQTRNVVPQLSKLSLERRQIVEDVGTCQNGFDEPKHACQASRSIDKSQEQI